MKRNGFTILAVLVFALGTFGLAYPNSGYWDNFKLAYSTSPLTNPPITNSAGQNCMVCHTGWPTTRAGVGTVNAYGNDYANANYNFGAIINNDPDGDGYTNLQEITAGTYPGDATSHPSAADTTPPVVGAFSIPATSTSLTVGITTFTATDVGGVTGYLLTETSTLPASPSWVATKPTSYTFASAGNKTLYAWAKDAAGNISVPLSASTTITLPDTIAPVVTGFSIPATSSSLTVAISSLTATDVGGVTGYMVTANSTIPGVSDGGWSSTAPTSYTFASAGAKTLYAWAKDAAGNVSVPLSAATTITSADVTAPMVTGFSIPATSSSLTVAITTFTATDDVGVTGYLVTEISATPSASAAAGWNGSAPASYTFPSAGAKRLYAWAKDAAGNISASMSQTIALSVSDTTPPVITNFRVPSRSSSPIIPVTLTATDDQGVTGYLVTEAAAKPTAADPRWRTTAPTSYTCSSGGYRTLHAWAKDAAGNISTGASRTMAVQWSGRTHRSDDERSDDRSRDD